MACYLRRHPDARLWLPGDEHAAHAGRWVRLVVRRIGARSGCLGRGIEDCAVLGLGVGRMIQLWGRGFGWAGK